MIASEHHRRSPAVRFYRQEQARLLFAAAGFVDVQIFRDSEWEPATAEAGQFTVVGKRPM